MSNFSHLSQYDVRDAIVRPYEIHEIEGVPVLQVKPATEANKPYYNAVLRKSGRGLRKNS